MAPHKLLLRFYQGSISHSTQIYHIGRQWLFLVNNYFFTEFEIQGESNNVIKKPTLVF